MPDAHYDHPRLAKLYDYDSAWSKDREFYLNLAGNSPINVLDLGCGTGMLCDAYAAKGHNVTGLDPSPAMLDVARQKPNGNNINWVQSNAQSFSIGKKFDLIIMTGHAFQVMQNNSDILQTFKAVQQHLTPKGIFTFETRNPSIDWPTLWHQDYILELADENVEISRRVLSYENERLVFEHYFKFSDETLKSVSDLRFMPYDDIIKNLQTAGLKVNNFIGDWNGSAYDPATSKEMIFSLGVI